MQSTSWARRPFWLIALFLLGTTAAPALSLVFTGQHKSSVGTATLGIRSLTGPSAINYPIRSSPVLRFQLMVAPMALRRAKLGESPADRSPESFLPFSIMETSKSGNYCDGTRCNCFTSRTEFRLERVRFVIFLLRWLREGEMVWGEEADSRVGHEKQFLCVCLFSRNLINFLLDLYIFRKFGSGSWPFQK